MQEKGTISVSTENIFPIIKKFLYSDHEIFLRELVANAMDASQKLKRLAAIGEYQGEVGELKVQVSIDEEAGTITVSDAGIGMTAEDIKKYINQVAFSGATEFIEQYKDSDQGDSKEIIGHFGMGFYSAFMVADKVKIVSLSHKEGAEAAQWECEGSTEFEISPGEKKERGTDIVLQVAEDSKEFLNKARLRGILDKYCKFLPITIELDGEQINNTTPIWTKSPSELKDEDYLAFFKELYPMSPDPLFWIHLNVDYPFNLTGVLYFPKITNNFDLYKDKIQLYSRQVFITDEVKDVVPEFLMLLRGVIDSPDIPLNVSRSYLQSDANVKKINGYVTRKVADKLEELFKKERTAFEEKWESVGFFVKYGILSDEKFYDKAKNICLLKNSEGKYFTLDEYREHIQAAQTDKNENVVYLYSNDPDKQDAYISSARKQNYDVLLLDNQMIDSHFVGSLESKIPNSSFKRVDADTMDKLIDTGTEKESVLSEEEATKIKEVFEKTLNNNALNLQVEALPTDELPVVITVPEFMRRAQEMAKTSGMMGLGEFPSALTVSINGNHSIIQKILKAEEAAQKALVLQAYDLALLSQNLLSGANLTKFIERSVEMVGK
ncbi:molecular chaperone HtpG [Microscilla marina]|uniref:Chaperone protein HtpG n=1 Tax=Microscilla marina ATCC 23134 TaxID=313606 RepID=A1ZHH2_MICM2|nr:molecular chaperone HtpG [Microscilla marina]EAY29979.1 chaperone protein HtpG [Microscilla marina ATCC 23134]